jgi:hypothetical protein
VKSEMIMAEIETRHHLAALRIGIIKFVRADHVVFAPETEEFAFDGIDTVVTADFFVGEDGIERFHETGARTEAIRGLILGAVGNPVVDHTR